MLLKNTLFIDIETVPQVYQYSDLDLDTKDLWDEKCRYMLNENETTETLYVKSGFYAEFSKVACISVGYVEIINNESTIRIGSFYGENEKEILTEFTEFLNNNFGTEDHYLVAHNGKAFDFPFINRRLLINGMPIPEILNNWTKKPWELRLRDTMELWKFGDYKYSSSLKLLCRVFNVPTPKDDIDGSDVSRVFWEEKDYKRIADYCEKDVIATIRIFLKLMLRPDIEKVSQFRLIAQE